MMMMVMTGMMCHWRARVSWSIPQGAGECNNVWPAIQYDILYKRWYLPHHHHRHITAQRSYPSSPSFNKKWGFSVIQWWSIGWGQSCTIQASFQQWISLIALIVSDPISLRWNVLLFAIGLLWLPVEGFPILGGIAKCSGKCIETAESIKIIQDTGYGYKRVSLYVQHIKNCKLGWYFRILKHCLFSDCWQQLFIYPVCKERLCREIVRRLLSICAESFMYDVCRESIPAGGAASDSQTWFWFNDPLTITTRRLFCHSTQYGVATVLYFTHIPIFSSTMRRGPN